MPDVKTEHIDFSEIVARYGADLATIFSHMPTDKADAAIDEFAAGLKEGADTFRTSRLARLRQGIG